LAAPETAATLDDDVAAMMLNHQLMYSLRSPTGLVPNADILLRAWRSISVEDRSFWRVIHNLDGLGHPLRQDVATGIGTVGSSVTGRTEQVRESIKDFLWHKGGFYGLNGKARSLLRRDGIANPEALQANVLVLRNTGWGAVLYVELNAWLIEHNHPSLDDKLPGYLRHKFRISK
jgi:hypothetical protein